MLDTWHRLERVIKWAGLSVNSFALTIGLKRSENLYQIKRGNNGISRDLVNLIVTKYPNISKGWLMTGEGEMLIESQQSSSLSDSQGIPYYGMDVLMAVEDENAKMPEPRFKLHIPLFSDCDLAALNVGTAMQPEIPSGAIVVLKKWTINSIIPGETYLIVTPYFKGIRIVRFGERPTDLQLVASNTDQYDPISIQNSSILKLYIVRGIIIKKSL